MFKVRKEMIVGIWFYLRKNASFHKVPPSHGCFIHRPIIFAESKIKLEENKLR